MLMMTPADLTTIAAVTRLTGVSAHSLRAWERRYLAVKPARSPSGRRLYNLEQIERIRCLAKLTRLGHQISNLADLADAELHRLISAADQGQTNADATSRPEEIREIMTALEVFDLQKAGGAIARSLVRFGVTAFALEVVCPLLQEIGRAVAAGRLSIAHEHALSSILRMQIDATLLRLQAQPSATATAVLSVVITSQEGDHHEFGIQLAALLCAANGVTTYYLGPNLPADVLAETHKAFAAPAVLFAASLLPDSFLPMARAECLRRLDANLPRGVEIWVGGPCSATDLNLSQRRQVRYFPTLVDLNGFLSPPPPPKVVGMQG